MCLAYVNGRKVCKCEDCGREFLKGDEGDNERFCLRCEHNWFTEIESDGDHEGDEP